MQVSVLLQVKGTHVVTVRPDHSVADVCGVLSENRIGAVVVSDDDNRVLGILSERDIIRALAARGSRVLHESAKELMTAEVVTCQPDTTVEHLMATMTERRIRHVPVVVDDGLIGLVSIGDVVKDRISGLETETQAMHAYISNPY